MFRRDPLRAAQPDLTRLLGRDVGPDLPAVRAVYARGGVLGMTRGDESVLVPLGGVPADGVFELASVTKPVTAALAGALVRAGALAWDAPLRVLGGPFRSLPGALTPRALATHTAGLPMHPARAMVTTFTRYHDPYGGMSATDVIASAARWANPRAAGRLVYSNLGAGLLALACAHAAGEATSAAGYGRALARLVTGPLGLPGLTLAPPPGVVRPTGPLGPTAVTGFGPLAGAGGLYGTAADLLRFGQAHLNGRAGLHWAEVTHPRPRPAHLSGVAPGWLVSRDVRWHDGVARGTRAALGFHPGSGVVVTLLVRGGPPVLGARGAVPALLLALLGPPQVRARNG
jgi:CubicO group peptidase (beta-lactamase class C family)